MYQWPLTWFFDGKFEFIDSSYLEYNNDEDKKSAIETRANWQYLTYFGWNNTHLEGIEYADLPEAPGVYVVAHELEQPALYVGQSVNLKHRLTNRNHHKIKAIVNCWENAPFGYHNKENVRNEIQIFWKVLPKVCYNGSVDRTLSWCESIAIGLLCPIMQGNIEDIENQDWAFGMKFYD